MPIPILKQNDDTMYWQHKSHIRSLLFHIHFKILKNLMVWVLLLLCSLIVMPSICNCREVLPRNVGRILVYAHMLFLKFNFTQDFVLFKEETLDDFVELSYTIAVLPPHQARKKCGCCTFPGIDQWKTYWLFCIHQYCKFQVYISG